MVLRRADFDACQSHARPSILGIQPDGSREFDDRAVVIPGAFGTFADPNGVRGCATRQEHCGEAENDESGAPRGAPSAEDPVREFSDPGHF
jgi:hypothetical protein